MPVSPIRLGLRENAGQFSLLVLVNAFVDAMVGLERSILPAIAEQEFQLAARSAILSFIVAFGIAKALTNYFAGRLSDRYGRKHVLIATGRIHHFLALDDLVQRVDLIPNLSRTLELQVFGSHLHLGF